MVRLAVNGFIGAIVFLTRIPVRTRRHLDTASSVPWFPFVGALIGAAVGGIAALLQPWASPAVAAGVAIAVGLVVTGCFHEDGLGDVADAYVGGWTRDDRLRILKDSRHGTYGVAAIGTSIALRIVTLAAIVEAGPNVVVAAAVSAHSIARAGALGVMLVGQPAVGEGLGADYVGNLRRGAVAAGALVGALISALLIGWWILPVVAGAVVVAVAMNAWTNHKIGGFSGDLLGATEQVVEITTLVIVSVLARHHPLWW